MKTLILFLFILCSNLGFSQIKLNFEEPCKVCGLEHLKNAPENRSASVMFHSTDRTQQIGYSIERKEYINSNGTLSYSIKKYIHCSVTTKEKPKSKRLYIQLSDKSKISMIGVKIEFNPSTELYTVYGKKPINSKSLQKKFKYETVTHFGNYQETIPMDNNLSYVANNLFLCIFFR